MSEQDNHPNKYSELRSISKYYIDSFNALYHLKTKNEEELKDIYKMIKTELIDSKKYLPEYIIKDILGIIPYNNRYTKSYLSLAKLISDDYHVQEVRNTILISNFLFYKEYGIKLDKSDYFEKSDSENLDIHTENTIYRAIMYNDLEKFIAFTERDGFDEDQTLESDLYPVYYPKYSLLELCCYHGAVDCFKLLISKFHSEITQSCLQLSFLGGNQEIMSECLKYQTPSKECMFYAILSHNIDFVTFLMNEYNIEIDLENCGRFNNLESFLVYFDQTNDINKCFIYSTQFKTLSFCEYFLSCGANIDAKDESGETALHIATQVNSTEIVEFLISHGAKINQKDNDGFTALHCTIFYFNKELAELLVTHGANINEKDYDGKTPLHIAAFNNIKEVAELLISHGANINEIDASGRTALDVAIYTNSKEMMELLFSHDAEFNSTL
ncbi:hypothetical protein TVAG_062730 [Trichomonas vaginalis G3]|uniref:DUF3447 domain-containing protein n=1 Tax=Trichomonas vaginalis (strain ATCC PRA-98 / G3) TaxID=412133 RepID=A2DLN5_TRIV3|nr:protein kinase protein [Trichomonas vaginalis G3]EAY18668.1 hypothetical protein TVAG_062730 [Trichomonas vaginalis G3]KAI5522566.1 protein kinase protein [Trichomonas vaginalis G3]|eukprot:XP_001579654.1 hypothetical protein [Trichomonas vaginalis G3]